MSHVINYHIYETRLWGLSLIRYQTIYSFHKYVITRDIVCYSLYISREFVSDTTIQWKPFEPACVGPTKVPFSAWEWYSMCRKIRLNNLSSKPSWHSDRLVNCETPINLWCKCHLSLRYLPHLLILNHTPPYLTVIHCVFHSGCRFCER